MMKTIYIILLTFLPLTVSAQKQKQLVVLHTGDMHSTIQPINSQLPDTMKAGRAGMIRRIEMLRQEREKHPDLLLFDTGDFFQGSAYFTLFKGEVEVGLMNKMGYDAVMIGNHHRVCQLRLYWNTSRRTCQTLYYHQTQWGEDRRVWYRKEDGRTCCS